MLRGRMRTDLQVIPFANEHVHAAAELLADREAGEGLLGLKPGEYVKQRVEQIPLGRIERAEDVANVVGFLASSKSSYMTGQAINVTGGLVMH